MSDILVYSVGFIAQILFSSRLIVQWLTSEKKKKVATPKTFWVLSLLASLLLFIYGYLRSDFAIMLGQALTYFIYIRNLQLQGEWSRFPKLVQGFLILFPTFIVVYYYNNSVIDLDVLFDTNQISTSLMILGIVSQIVFTFRFIYQWLYSEYKKKSNLPLGFWILSVIGSILILAYAYFRKDPVLLIGHGLGLSIYIRNIIIMKKSHVSEA